MGVRESTIERPLVAHLGLLSDPPALPESRQMPMAGFGRQEIYASGNCRPQAARCDFRKRTFKRTTRRASIGVVLVALHVELHVTARRGKVLGSGPIATEISPVAPCAANCA
jgi:hypothetical protein